MRKLIALALPLAIALHAGGAEVRNPIAIDEWTVPYDLSRLRDPDVRSRTEVWFVGQRGHYLARLNPETGEFVRRDLADAAGPYSLAVGADGIVILPDGAPWIALFGTNKLVSIDPKSLKLVEYALPDAGARPRRIGASCDGRIYHTGYARGYLGRSDPKTRTVEEWAVPLDHGARPYAMAVGARDRVWFVETGPSSNTLVGFLAPDRDFLLGNADLLGRVFGAAHGLLCRDEDDLVRDRRDYHRPRQAGRVRTKALAASAISRRRPHSAGHGPASVDSGAGRG